MAQTSITSYFGSRKRVATDDITSARNKVLLLDNDMSNTNVDFGLLAKTLLHNTAECQKIIKFQDKKDDKNNNPSAPVRRNKVITKLNFDSAKPPPLKARTRKTTAKATPAADQGLKQTCIFKKLGPLSPVKKISKEQVNLTNKTAAKTDTSASAPYAPATLQNASNELQSESKSVVPNTISDKLNNGKEISLSEIKSKITRSSRLAELKSTMNRLNQGMQKLEKIEKKCQKLDLQNPSLKEFKSINLEVITSPQKALTSPRKTLYSPHKINNNGGIMEPLMSPRKTTAVRKLLQSPVKASVTAPAYQRFQGLAENALPSLTLPYNYRCLAELFRSVDAVCAMLYNRKETITFQKLKPAVQEMTRKNFTESHLAQIKSIYPDAFSFSQEKIHNFGSTSKQDKYQLVIVPKVNDGANSKSIEINADDVMKSRQEMTMNPQIMLERQRKLYSLLLAKVIDKHEEYLLTLDPPLNIPRNKLTRWHPGFDIENMPDIEKADIPQPPNIEKFTSANDVLLKARNLFNCNTRMERALERLAEAKSKNVPLSSLGNNMDNKQVIKVEDVEVKTEPIETELPLNPALKGVPKSLLEKIRAKQAAKALEAMTRSPAQDKKATKYQRLPEIARHMRSVFVTEKKSVLPLDLVLKKLGNSYKTSLTATELEEHLRLLSESLPGWLVFHDIRQTMFVKLSRDADMTKVQNRLEALVLKNSK